MFGKNDSIFADKNAVVLCGPSTGHVGTPVAYCDSPERATLIVEALRAQADRTTDAQP